MFVVQEITSFHELNSCQRSQKEEHRAVKQGPPHSQLFGVYLCSCCGSQWFLSEDLSSKALCHFLTANSFSFCLSVTSLPPPTHLDTHFLTTFQLSLTLVGKRAKVKDSAGLSFPFWVKERNPKRVFDLIVDMC